MKVELLRENRRKCGFRHSGKDGVGLYLMGGMLSEACERLPFPLDVCPTCGAGVKFARGWTWIDPGKLFGPSVEPMCIPNNMWNHDHGLCHMCSPQEKPAGLMWVGEKFYSTIDFLNEAHMMGVSKRISAVPRGFTMGSIVYLAHKHAVLEYANLKAGTYAEGEVVKMQPRMTPGVFTAFKPTSIDIVVDTTDVDSLPARARKLAEKFGDSARLVKIEPIQQMTLPEE